MSPKKIGKDVDGLDEIVDEVRHNREHREKSYRERALKLFPWICGRCGREFTGKRLHELTVHHKDHDHTNNKPDGSNWELLCLYCHDNEHSRFVDERWYDSSSSRNEEESPSTYRPFDGLGALLKDKK